jgi:hypothetical protein
MFQKTKRSFENYHTKEMFDMFQHSETHELVLINRETETQCKTFYCCAFTDVDLKLNTGGQIRLNTGQFIDTSIYKPTHKKFFMQNRFSKFKN